MPDADTVFRIASMTKSFTAATLLLLRDEGRLGSTSRSRPTCRSSRAGRRRPRTPGAVTVRQLLTMSAGLATDDPWGDRQQGLALDRFAELLAAGPAFTWPPGTAFDYSNLGYGILGRVVTNVAGKEYREVVRDRLLAPLGMRSTAYLEEEVDEARLAHGYERIGDELVREGTDGYGALASMGGIFSTVRDLARWVAGFLDAFPARSDPEGPHRCGGRPAGRCSSCSAGSAWRSVRVLRTRNHRSSPAGTGPGCSSCRTRISGRWSATPAGTRGSDPT